MRNILLVLFCSFFFLASCVEKKSRTNVVGQKAKKEWKKRNAGTIQTPLVKISSEKEFYKVLGNLQGFTKAEAYKIAYYNRNSKTALISKAKTKKLLGERKFKLYSSFKIKNFKESWNKK